MKFILVHGLDELQRIMQSGPKQKLQCVIFNCRLDFRSGHTFVGGDNTQRPLILTNTTTGMIACRLKDNEAVPEGVAAVTSIRM
jgi:hypothetical protein